MGADMASSTFGERLRELRQARGLTQEKLAELAGLHRRAIVKLERSERGGHWESVLALAKALGVDVTEFQKPAAGAKPQPRGRPKKPAGGAKKGKPKGGK